MNPSNASESAPIPAQHEHANPGNAAASRGRNSTLDAARLLSALAILWMHTWESAFRRSVGEVGRFAVPFFMMASTYLLMRSLARDPHKPFLPHLKQRFVRLYLPFLGWAAIGAGAMAVKHRWISHSPMAPLGWGDLLTGRSFQLWFLPFLFLVGLATFPIGRLLAHPTPSTRLGFGVGAIILGTALCFVQLKLPAVTDSGDSAFDLNYFASLGWGAVPSIFWGLGLSLLVQRLPLPRWQSWLGLTATVLTMATITRWQRNTFLETLGGLGFMWFALGDFRSPLLAALGRFPFLSYGIYLSQGVILESIQTIAGRAHLGSSSLVEVSVFAITAGSCVALCMALRKSKWLRWLLG